MAVVALIEVAPAEWAEHNGRGPFAVRHRLVGHPMLTPGAAAELAARLPEHLINVYSADVDPLNDEDPSPPDRNPHELATDIERLRRYLVLKRIEQDPAYRALVDEVLLSVGDDVGFSEAMRHREGYLFLSPPRSVTPAHVDHEHNFLLQIRGTKTVTIGSFPDPQTEAEHMEALQSGTYGFTGFPPHEPQVFDLEPGTGVYIPPRAVHLVQNGDELSVSLSVVFHTAALQRAARVYRVNAKMRSRGLHPRPPARSALADRSKSALMLTWEALHRHRVH